MPRKDTVIPRILLKKWRRVMDEYTDEFGSVSGIVARVHRDEMKVEVLATSSKLGNPFHAGNIWDYDKSFFSYQNIHHSTFICNVEDHEKELSNFELSIMNRFGFTCVYFGKLVWSDQETFGFVGIFTEETQAEPTKSYLFDTLVKELNIDLEDIEHGELYTEENIKAHYYDDDIYNKFLSRIESLRHENERLESIANLDYLTRLYNRRYYTQVEQLYIEKYNEDLIPFSVIGIDLDGFKKVNDVHGHNLGDLILQEFARIINRLIRGEDLCGRMGGDEFAVLLPSAPLSVAIKVADRLLNDVRNNELMSSYGVTLSIGVCQYQFKESQRDFASRIDGLMYEAKKRGKNTMVYKEEV